MFTRARGRFPRPVSIVHQPPYRFSSHGKFYILPSSQICSQSPCRYFEYVEPSLAGVMRARSHFCGFGCLDPVIASSIQRSDETSFGAVIFLKAQQVTIQLNVESSSWQIFENSHWMKLNGASWGFLMICLQLATWNLLLVHHSRLKIASIYCWESWSQRTSAHTRYFNRDGDYQTQRNYRIREADDSMYMKMKVTGTGK